MVVMVTGAPVSLCPLFPFTPHLDTLLDVRQSQSVQYFSFALAEKWVMTEVDPLTGKRLGDTLLSSATSALLLTACMTEIGCGSQSPLRA
jgi:hypothetical protein